MVEEPAGAEPTVMAWRDGERELWWSRAAALEHGLERDDWVTAVRGAVNLSDLAPEQVPWLFAKGPETVARALLGKSAYLRHHQRADLGRVAAARFELDATAYVLAEAAENPDRLGLLVLPFRGPEVAALVAGWLRHLGSARLWARLWLDRHPECAVRALVPVAAGKPGRARQNAEAALRFLSAAGHGPIMTRSGEQALLPAGKNRMVLEQLPEIRTVTGGIMPEDHVARLVTALTRSSLDDPPEPAPGDADRPVPLVVESSAAAQPAVRAPEKELAELIASADRASLAGFGRAMLDQWVTAGMAPAESWVLLAQAHLGDDATMDVLAPLVRSWPAKSRHARAVDGFAVLATVGSEVALRHLLAIEANMSGGPTNERATVYLTQAAAARGLSVTGLADRLAITHGLETGVRVDYGSRSFRVHADEHLVAHVVNADGRMLARPPKPGVKDVKPAAYQQFLQFKKDLRATAVAQAGRLERDMVHRRLRPARDLPGVLLPHPVLGPIARRLLWGEFDGRRLVRALRIAEDGSFADLHDDSADVSADARLGIVHPADLGADLDRWAQIFADYEIVAPFPQLGRAMVALTEEQRAATGLPGSGTLNAERLLALMRNRWHGDGFHINSRVHNRLARKLPGGLTLLAELSPGMPASAYLTTGEHAITEIWVDEAWSDHWHPFRRTAIGEVDPVALSEALVELYAARV
ncbi:DUF4132 domain-containing protein [Actinoplanes derwentensis]|uniref:DUF4132 domain-containing protein n=1 Tax=Actinoplanes derwentensis TaxID=113562 RepID=UPI000B80CE6D|nr:DUF4132 domain-containing protein [Actinoplanes derwentensis]